VNISLTAVTVWLTRRSAQPVLYDVVRRAVCIHKINALTFAIRSRARSGVRHASSYYLSRRDRDRNERIPVRSTLWEAVESILLPFSSVLSLWVVYYTLLLHSWSFIFCRHIARHRSEVGVILTSFDRQRNVADAKHRIER